MRATMHIGELEVAALTSKSEAFVSDARWWHQGRERELCSRWHDQPPFSPMNSTQFRSSRPFRQKQIPSSHWRSEAEKSRRITKITR